MRSDLYLNPDEEDKIPDEKYIKDIAKYAVDYLNSNGMETAVPVKMSDKLALWKEVDGNDFIFSLCGISNGYTYSPDRLRIAFDPREDYCAFNEREGYYIALNSLSLIFYYVDIIDKVPFYKWLSANKDNIKQSEEDLLNDLEEELSKVNPKKKEIIN